MKKIKLIFEKNGNIFRMYYTKRNNKEGKEFVYKPDGRVFSHSIFKNNRITGISIYIADKDYGKKC